MTKYNPIETEKKWRKIWSESELYKTNQDPSDKLYNLVMFPYPSGNLHIGHWYNFAPADTMARFSKMNGKDVLEPIGFDAFGLPAENAAIQRGLMADEWTDKNIDTMLEQLKMIGTMFDWNRIIDTSKPDYYKWTQWLFLQLYKKGKAYQNEGLVNWCPKDKTVLANEQVVNGECDRCGTKVEKKNLKQWYFKITDYTDRLLKGLDKIDWPNNIKEMQRNWIGRSEGASITFPVNGGNSKLEVYTTRPDTIFGATFMVLAPENPLLDYIVTDEQREQVQDYISESGKKTDVERMENKQKTGVFSGSYAVNPATRENIPIWVSDYVLMGYGTGAIMAVPAHDERDYEFAIKFGLDIKQVIKTAESTGLPSSGGGILINSDQFNGLDVEQAKNQITDWLKNNKWGKKQHQYKIRDWLVSRQRYWGAPIPMIHCEHCGVVPVDEKDLPVALPLSQKFGRDGRSPLLENTDFLDVECPQCSKPAKRETDTMDTFVDSSWYYLRYPNPSYDEGPFDPKEVKKWLPVDRYIGGAEHAVLHLLYARFIAMFFYDLGLIDFEEPFTKLINQGMMLGPDGLKMSKSKGNVIDPDDYVGKYGADSVRLYLMFMGPYEDGGPWDPKRFEGVYRFINRLWDLISSEYVQNEVNSVIEAELESRLHKTIKKAGHDLGALRFNTAISSLMEYVNYASTVKRDGGVSKSVWNETISTLTKIIAPLTPYMAEELWSRQGNKDSVHNEKWPIYNPDLVKDDVLTIVIQINGKLRGEFIVNAEEAFDKPTLENLARQNIGSKIEGQDIKNTVVVPGKLVNFVLARS